MKDLSDYGIRIIDHGCWSDPEVEWKKSDYQTLLFNYWDCVECFDSDEYDFSNEDDLQDFADWIRELTPSEYDCPDIYYEWEILNLNRGCYDYYDDCDFFKDNGLSKKEDYVLHNSSQALSQALQCIDENGFMKAEIEIFRHSYLGKEKVAEYSVNGSILKDTMSYKKCA